MNVLTGLGAVALAGGIALAATPYSQVDITIKTEMSDGQLSTSPSASPVLGIQNPKVRGGVAYVGMARQMGEYSAVLGTKLPVNLHLNLSQGSLRGQLTGLTLRGLDLATNQTDVNLKLPAGSYGGTLRTQQGEVQLQVPAGTGVQLILQKFSMGSLTINGAVVVDTLQASGTYATPNFESARTKIRLTVISQQTDLIVKNQ
ncbi:hypothetical protein [Deinococcus arcticus]|uniref:Cell wall-active antibiotics response LiaF-like C-terminal domain-containing protein n=1 Tax=Deinococcus arcticus TaxID=2136176 RepID=A0A2T3W546_9DEIO|nr:hypothetical protein [Deinococcus arcticus]PTA67025.1 hypothetical protein C8263_15045 [Deinococcus arcticus]